MPNEKVVTREDATADYMAGMSYAGIAEKYGVSLNTVKSWKQRYGWDRKGAHTEKVCTPAKRVQKDADRVPKRPTPDERDGKLTEKERLFCEYYVERFNATEAIRKVGYSQKSAKQAAYMVIHRPHCKRYIEKLKEWKREMLLAGPEDILERYMRIAFSDIGEVVTFGQREVPVLNEITGLPIMLTDPKDPDAKPRMLTRIESYVDVNDAANVDTSLISEISQGRDGAVKVKMVDQRGALEFLRQFFNMNPLDAHKVAYDNARLEIEKRDNDTSPVTVVVDDDYGDGV
jgi:phage terminase small subunit